MLIPWTLVSLQYSTSFYKKKESSYKTSLSETKQKTQIFDYFYFLTKRFTESFTAACHMQLQRERD